MSLFGLLEKRSTLANPDRFLMGVFGGRATESGLMVSEQNALCYSTVWACVHVIATALGKLPLNLYRRLDNGDHELVSNMQGGGPIASLLSLAPNEEMGAAAFKETLMGWVLTWGNGYAEIERDNAGRPIALHPLAPNRIVPRRRMMDPLTGKRDFRIEYYVTRTAMTSPYLLEQQTLSDGPIDRDDMLHFAGLGFDGIVGYSPVAMAREAIGLGLSAQAYGARFFGNSGVPSGVLESDREIKNPAKLREEWAKVHGGQGQRGTAVLEFGVKYKNIGLPPEDSQFLETRKFQRSDLCGIYRVPPHKIGDLDRSTNNNIEHQEMEFLNDCLMGWLVRFEQECGRKLLTPQQIAAGYFYAFDVGQVLRGDMAARYTAYATARQWGWMSANDVRRREKQNALPQGQGDIYLVPMNMVPADAIDKVTGGQGDKENVPPGGDPPNPNPPADPPSEGTRTIEAAKLRASLRGLLQDAAKRVVHKETTAIRRAAARPATFAAAAREFYAGHGDHLRAMLLMPAAACAELVDVPFAAVRDSVERLTREVIGRSMTELADPKLDVEALMAKWDRERPVEMAETLLKGIGL